MTKPLVIFGAGDIAQLAHYYFSTDSAHEVVAFSVDAAHIDQDNFCGLPVVPFEEVTDAFPPREHDFFCRPELFQAQPATKRQIFGRKSRWIQYCKLHKFPRIGA